MDGTFVRASLKKCNIFVIFYGKPSLYWRSKQWDTFAIWSTFKELFFSKSIESFKSYSHFYAKVSNFSAKQTGYWLTHGIIVAEACLRAVKMVANPRSVNLNVMKRTAPVDLIFFFKLCIFSKNKATLDNLFHGSDQKCSKELKNHSFILVENKFVKLL